MDRDLRIFFLFIGLPAVMLTAAGLLTLVFGVSGLAAEMQSPGYAKQLERYERNVRGRMATRLKAYRRGGITNGMWVADCTSLGTNLPTRTKYGFLSTPDGKTVGWARIDNRTVLCGVEIPFRYVDRRKLYLIAVGTVMVVLLFFTLFAGGWLLVRAARRAREDLATKNSFLDVISHELNTPLGSIVPLSSALAADGIRSEGRRREAIDTIRRESARMARMIAELLTVVRLRNGKVRYARDRFDLGEVAGHAADLVRVRYQDCAIRVVCDEPVFAMADRDKAEQVAINLMENACRYAGDETIEVACRRTADGRVQLAVADRGAVIPAAQRIHLFERFYQGPSDRPEPGQGLGLGLNIVAGFVKGMGGRVSVAARPGGGNVFTVELAGGEAPAREEVDHG